MGVARKPAPTTGRRGRGLCPRPRPDGEAGLRASGGGGNRIQPAEARTPVSLLPHAMHRKAQAGACGRGASGERDLGDAFALDAGGVPRVRLSREEAPACAGGRVMRERVGDRGLRSGGSEVSVQDQEVEVDTQGVPGAAGGTGCVARRVRRMAVRGAGSPPGLVGPGAENVFCETARREDAEEEEDPSAEEVHTTDDSRP